MRNHAVSRESLYEILSSYSNIERTALRNDTKITPLLCNSQKHFRPENRSLLLLSGSDIEQEADSNMDIATSVGEIPISVMAG